MSTMKYLFLFFTIICTFQEMQAYGRRGGHASNWKNTNQKVAVYMGCDIRDRIHCDCCGMYLIQPDCNVTLEKANSYGSVDRLTCNIKRPPFSNLTNFHYEISAAVSAEVVVLYGTGRSWAKIQIIHMKECRQRDIYLDVEPTRYDDFGIAEINVTLSDGAVDVFYEDKHECRDGVCMASYDFSGKSLGHPIQIPRNSNNANKNKVTYVFGEQYAGQISLMYDYESIKLVQYQLKNASQVLFELPRRNVTVLSISTQKKLFGLCYKWNHYQKGACLQYDNKGHQIIDASFFFSKSWTSLRVTNRYEGNFTAMATNCTISRECDPERDIYKIEIMDKKLKYSKPKGFIPLFCRSRVGNKAEMEVGFDYATYLNCKPSVRGHSHTFMFKSWCSEFIRCTPVIL